MWVNYSKCALGGRRPVNEYKLHWQKLKEVPNEIIDNW